jgi:hypothetical protein
MVSIDNFRQIALSFPGVTEEPHFEKPSFRFNGKVFATIWESENRGMIRLSVIDQSVYCDYDASVFFPVPGGWGRQGATMVELKNAKKAILKEAMAIAYNNAAAKKPAKK